MSRAAFFESAFRKAQEALGLHHYHVTLEAYPDGEEPGNYAEILVDAANCIATVTWSPSLCSTEALASSVAVHECIHLLLADLKHAIKGRRKKGARVEEERVARRLEPIVTRGLFDFSAFPES